MIFRRFLSTPVPKRNDTKLGTMVLGGYVLGIGVIVSGLMGCRSLPDYIPLYDTARISDK